MNHRFLILLVLAITIAADLDFACDLSADDKPKEKGSKLGGYEKPPPANDVPKHLFDIVLGRPTDRGVTVRANCYENLECRVAYGAQKHQLGELTFALRFKKGEPADIVIDSLLADTRYFYRLEYRRQSTEPFESSDEYTFHTQRGPQISFVFTVQSDSHLDENTSPAVYERTLANALADGPDFHFELGDTFMTDKYVKPELALGQYLAQRYYFGQLCHSAPLFFVLGNHDGEPGDRGSNLWATETRKRYMPNPSPNGFYSGNEVQEPKLGFVENYYGWTWGDSLFVVLDPFRHTTKRAREKGKGKKGGDKKENTTGEDLWDRTLGQEQYDWLKKTLEKSHARFKFVFLHNLIGGKDRTGRGGIEVAPYFEWGGQNLDGVNEFDRKRPGWGLPIHQLLVKHRVTIVFHGHDHLFVKQDLDGIVYQEVPQPGYPRFGNVRSAAEYGYVQGEVQSSSGHLRVNVESDSVRVDYVRSYQPDQETSQRKNGDVSYSYLIRSENSPRK